MTELGQFKLSKVFKGMSYEDFYSFWNSNTFSDRRKDFILEFVLRDKTLKEISREANLSMDGTRILYWTTCAILTRKLHKYPELHDLMMEPSSKFENIEESKEDSSTKEIDDLTYIELIKLLEYNTFHKFWNSLDEYDQKILLELLLRDKTIEVIAQELNKNIEFVIVELSKLLSELRRILTIQRRQENSARNKKERNGKTNE